MFMLFFCLWLKNINITNDDYNYQYLIISICIHVGSLNLPAILFTLWHFFLKLSYMITCIMIIFNSPNFSAQIHEIFFCHSLCNAYVDIYILSFKYEASFYKQSFVTFYCRIKNGYHAMCKTKVQ